ncbi:MAG TPA: S9 family peptidase [Candidatus Eisenbacteria bacterium]|jgi:dipeptidyl aminopeptidase/acylaminoacyl peptidase
MTVMTSTSTVVYPARKGPRAFTAEDLWAIPRVGAPAVAPDGRLLAVPVTTYDLEKNEGRGRIWLVPAAGGEPRALTAPEHSSLQPAFSPDGRELAFVRKADKGKLQLFLMPVDGGEPRKLTDLPLGVFDPSWLPDGSGIVFAAMVLKGHFTPEATAAELERREKDPVKAHVTEDRLFRYWDTWLTTGEVPHLFLHDLASGKLRDLTPDSTLWFDWMEPTGQYDIAPDGSEIALAGISFYEDRSIVRSAIYTVPLSGGALRCLTSDHPADDARPRYTRDGRSIVYGMQHDPFFYADRVRLMRYDRAARKHEPLLEDWPLSPMHWEVAGDGTVVLEAENAARVDLFALRPGETPRPLTSRGSVSGPSVARDGRIHFTLQSLSAPAEVHACAADGRGLERVTRFTEPAAARFGLGEVREIEFEGAYGETVQMFLVLPPDHQPGRKVPLVQVVHGGPHGISGDQFHPRWNAQLFASPGYVVALVNFQGSTSWGQDFAERIQGAWGDRPFQDVMRATDLLVAGGVADETRMAACGGSYGGYMASWIEAHTDRFRCIVNHAGVFDTLSQYASDVTQGRDRSFGGEPWDGLEAIDRYNPARFAKGFATPMLVLHGEKDYRVPVTQGLECYGMLKAKGVPARLVYFPDENHWVLKPQNSLLWYREVHAWLKRWLAT